MRNLIIAIMAMVFISGACVVSANAAEPACTIVSKMDLNSVQIQFEDLPVPNGVDGFKLTALMLSPKGAKLFHDDSPYICEKVKMLSTLGKLTMSELESRAMEIAQFHGKVREFGFSALSASQ